MCGLIGIVHPKPSKQDINLFEDVLRESRIRGLHATGIAYMEDSCIYNFDLPTGSIGLLKQYKFNQFLDTDGSLKLIAHCRYSTSDLRYNQPIGDSLLQIAHNGVISQELPENWPKLYGSIGVCETSNDTELLYRTIQEGKSPFHVWPNSSIAAIELHANGLLRAYRNGRRPLYIADYRGGFIFTSTFDIGIRANLPNIPMQLPPFCYVDIRDYERQIISCDVAVKDDLQP